MELPGRRAALVTGAAGGIGRAVLVQGLSPAVADLAETGSVVTLQADVSLSKSARQAIALAEREIGRLDLLVDNAGQFPRSRIEDSANEDFDRLVAINVREPFVNSRESINPLRATRGAIVNLASISGLVGLPPQTVYAITKGAIVLFTRQLAVEQAANGIHVNTVAPGVVDTEFAASTKGGRPGSSCKPRLHRRSAPDGQSDHCRRDRRSDRLSRLRCGERNHRRNPQRRRRLRRSLTRLCIEIYTADRMTRRIQ